LQLWRGIGREYRAAIFYLCVFIYAPHKALVLRAQSYQNTRNFIYLKTHAIGATLTPVEPEKIENIFESFRNFTGFFFIEAFYQQLWFVPSVF
jgi:hypothetical protein